MNILIMLAYIEILIVVLALLSNTLFSFMIYQASSLHFNCRNLLFQFAFSMYLLTIFHGLTVFEFLYEGKTYEYVYFVSVRGITWRIFHEIGYALQSFSLILFSIERLVACICPASYSKKHMKVLFVILYLICLGLSIAFSLFIHMGGEMFLTTFSMDIVDIGGCVILLIAWKRSLLRYRSTVGVFSLEQRFQLSEVYTWSRHLIPAVLLASLTKMMVIITIWILITGNYTGNDAAIWVIIYNNILNIYTVILPFVILLKHHKIRQKLMHTQEQVEMRKTIDGKVIPKRYIAAKVFISQNFRNRTFSIIIGAVISVLSMIYAQVIHLVNFHIIAITCLNIVDMAALVVLILSSKFSIKNYRNTAGKASLEKRFQISDVYIWTEAIIPAACLAFLLKFTYVVIIWLLQNVEDSMTYQIQVSHFFQNVMDLFTCGIPFLVSANHRRLKNPKSKNQNRVNPTNALPVSVRTLDGKVLHLKTNIHEHFDFLKNHWK